MSRSIPAPVKPSVLRWARESCGLSQVAASRKIGLADDRVERWENGTITPTIKQLGDAARVYKRALAVFFLAEPPEDFDTLRDFRRIADAQEGEWSPDLHAEYRRAHQQREFAVELAELDEQSIPHDWRIKIPANKADDDIAARIRSMLLNIGPLSLPSGTPTQYDALNVWVAAVESAGVLVLATRGGRVPVSEMRAFSLYFDELPVIVVNGADTARGRLFSLLHEFAHLALHTSGLCDALADNKAIDPNRQLEARCNRIAASVLIPADELLSRPEVIARRSLPESWDYNTLRPLAAAFGVSAEAMLRRLADLGVVPMRVYEARREEFLAAYAREEKRPKSGNYYRNTVRDLGKGYVRAVADAYARRVIDSATAATYLNARVDRIPKLAETAQLRTAI